MSDEAQAPGRRAALSAGRTGPGVTAPHHDIHRVHHRTGAWLCLALGCLCACVGVVVGGHIPAQHTSVASGEQREATEGQRQLQYAYYAFELRPCIASLNFPVDTVPDLEEFLRQGPRLAWSPWNTVESSASHIEVARIRQICPRDPLAGY